MKNTKEKERERERKKEKTKTSEEIYKGFKLYKYVWRATIQYLTCPIQLKNPILSCPTLSYPAEWDLTWSAKYERQTPPKITSNLTLLHILCASKTKTSSFQSYEYLIENISKQISKKKKVYFDYRICFLAVAVKKKKLSWLVGFCGNHSKFFE